MITCVTVACKTVSDVYCTNPYFAKVGGISTQELNLLELEFCKLMNWNFCYSDALLQHYYCHMAMSAGFTVAPSSSVD